MPSEREPEQPPTPFTRTVGSGSRCEYDISGTPVVVEFEDRYWESARRVAFEANWPEEWDEGARMEEMRDKTPHVLIAHTPPQGMCPPPEYDTRTLAYEYYEQRNRLLGEETHGHHAEDWGRAGEELRVGRTIAALRFATRCCAWYDIHDIAVHPDARFREHLPALLKDAIETIARHNGYAVALSYKVSLDPHSRYTAVKKLIGLE